MNKLVKGAVAGAAGIALLLGGAGTFALWNATVGVSSGTISTGTLAFGTSASPVWTDKSAGALTTTFDPASQKIVPGDVVQLVQTVSVTGSGKNLVASLTYVPSSVAIPADLINAITPTLTVVQATGSAAATLTGSGTTASPYIITPTAAGGTSTYTVTISYAFAKATAGLVGQGESVDLAGATFQLQQIHS
jgi:alternate signal-mediated exported protein